MTFSINPTANKTQAMFEQMAIAQNGTVTAPPITGGTVSSAAAPSYTAATVAPAFSVASSAPTGLVSGSGSYISGGACECSCFCGVAAFPNAAVQGIGGYGGMSGSFPLYCYPSKPLTYDRCYTHVGSNVLRSFWQDGVQNLGQGQPGCLHEA
jgi:hypothetical protein